MNYYIQGCAAKADKIKAAFEDKGYDATGWKFNVEGVFYYTHDGIIDLACGKFLINLIKTHPYYKKLELPIEPQSKFKVGDWIVQNDNGTVSQITKTINGKDEYGEYRAYEHTNGYFAACFENEYHLWTIADARDGDVLAINWHEDNDSWEKIIIFKNYHAKCVKGLTKEPCVEGYGNTFKNGKLAFREEVPYYSRTWTDNLQPATKEQRNLLFQKMKENGCEWDAEKKELRKIKPHYDIKNFHAGMPVLVRDENDKKWCYLLYSHYDSTCVSRFRFNAGSVHWHQCIPYNDYTKHLLGTTDMPSEEYINW